MGASLRETGSREPSPDGLGPSGFDPARAKALLQYLADFGCNLNERSLVHDGKLIVDGEAADSAGEVGLQAYANLREFPVTVVTGSRYHNGKVFTPAIAMEARQRQDRETGLGPKGDSAGRKASPKSNPHHQEDEE